MFESVILVLVLISLYNPSPIFFLFCFINFILFFYNCILSADLSFSISTIIVFLNKLNNALLNPLIFLLLFILFSIIYYYKNSALNYRYVYALFIISIPSSIELAQPNYFLYNLFVSSFAPTLTNGLLIIHPLLLYSFYVALIYFGIWIPLLKKTKKTKLSLFYPYNLPYGKFYVLGIGALFLGAWWSHQELNWGGFWSWDLVEIFLLITVTYVVLRQHYTSLTQVSYLKTIFFGLNFVMYICSVRYNLINSIHNFISQSAFLYKITYFILFYSLLFIILSFYWWRCCKTINFSKTYKHVYLFLESLYLVLVVYVFVTYLGFYLASVSSLLMINIIPIVLNTTYVSLLAPYTSGLGLYLPFIESVLVSIILYYPWRLKLIWAIHLLIIIVLLKITLWYGTILLAPLGNCIVLLQSLSYNAITIVESSQLFWQNTYSYYNLPWLSLYVDNTNNSIFKSSYDLVIYSTPIFAQNLSLTFFMHKYFGKISFSENILILAVISLFFLLKKFNYRIKIIF